MSPTPHPLTHWVHRLEQALDRLKYRQAPAGPLWVQTYRGFGVAQRIFLRGRVLRQKRLRHSEALLSRLYNAFQRFESDEIPYARLRLRCGSAVQEVRADEEGYFAVWLELPVPYDPQQPAWVELIDPSPAGASPSAFMSEIVIPPSDCRVGILSDIDDTVVQTGATHPLRALSALVFQSARTRYSFPGTAAFFCALAGQKSPVFYLSTSPWNLYDLLDDYLRLKHFPSQPLLALRDWGITEHELLPLDNRAHKLNFIQQVLEVYGEMQFFLIGDTGQQDPEIYAEVVRRYPGRIRAVYLREVSAAPRRIAAVEALCASLGKAGVPAVAAATVLPLAAHAQAQGWITPGELGRVAQEFKGV